MHDFDNNDKLDGLEILIAVNHSIESNPNENMTFDQKESEYTINKNLTQFLFNEKNY